MSLLLKRTCPWLNTCFRLYSLEIGTLHLQRCRNGMVVASNRKRFHHFSLGLPSSHLCPTDPEILTRRFSTSNDRFNKDNEGTSEAKGSKKTKLGSITPRLGIMYKCKICGSRNGHSFSKQAYEEGVVIVKCVSCQSNHLIADNLGWFKDVNKRNIEEIMASKGEEVTRSSNFDIPPEMLEQLKQQSEE